MPQIGFGGHTGGNDGNHQTKPRRNLKTIELLRIVNADIQFVRITTPNRLSNDKYFPFSFPNFKKDSDLCSRKI